jgi:hypothetical protein
MHTWKDDVEHSAANLALNMGTNTYSYNCINTRRLAVDYGPNY